MDEFHCFDPSTVGRPDDYTGYWEAYWPNGKLKYRGHFINGVEVGQQVCYWEDGTVAQVSWRDRSGNPRGTTVSYYPDGDKETEETWDDEARHQGTFVRRDYDANGDVTAWRKYHEFEVVESWERPCDVAKDETDIEIDRIVDDAVRRISKLAQSQNDNEDDGSI